MVHNYRSWFTISCICITSVNYSKFDPKSSSEDNMNMEGFITVASQKIFDTYSQPSMNYKNYTRRQLSKRRQYNLLINLSMLHSAQNQEMSSASSRLMLCDSWFAVRLIRLALTGFLASKMSFNSSRVRSLVSGKNQ